jgi:hypothetical protein
MFLILSASPKISWLEVSVNEQLRPIGWRDGQEVAMRVIVIFPIMLAILILVSISAKPPLEWPTMGHCCLIVLLSHTASSANDPLL